MRNETVEAVNQNGIGLRLEFRWLDDRYGHLISRIQGDCDPEPLLESLEGAPLDAWPSSPPLQSLTIAELPDGRTAALLVGMAGRTHWSASIEPAADCAGLIVDIACRLASPPGSLGSHYRWLTSGSQPVSIESTDADINRTSDASQILPRTVAGSTVRWRYSIALKRAQH